MLLQLQDGSVGGLKTFAGELVEKEEGKPLVAVVSTEDLDSDGDIIRHEANDRGKGWQLDRFNKSPRVFWMHDKTTPNLAKGKAVVQNKRLLLHVVFDPQDALAQKLDQKYRDGYLTEWSVGFKARKEHASPLDSGGFEFFETTLREVSAVNMGANPSTAMVQKAFGIVPLAPQVDDGESQRTKELIDDLIDSVAEFRARIDAIEAAVLRGAADDGMADRALDGIAATLNGIAGDVERAQR